ncbi:hypothetical protein C0Q70_13917 [Pomacea canaliculata]|uniref:Uncharacterized protein n=1 Tax=Pomacea canaliculata TaxID=400727 RepID=A0A2T7NYJ1_POMCA|nr:hypothetical protein C0Q70_13917 [Pomacea canaliculata]
MSEPAIKLEEVVVLLFMNGNYCCWNNQAHASTDISSVLLQADCTTAEIAFPDHSILCLFFSSPPHKTKN